MKGMAWKRPTRSLYWRVTPTSFMVFSTHGPEGDGQFISCLSLEVIRDCRIPAGEDLRASSKVISPIAFKKMSLAKGAAGLRPVHAQNKLIQLRAIADHPETLFQGFQLFGHQDLDRRILGSPSVFYRSG